MKTKSKLNQETILKIVEAILKVKGGRGYSTGTVYKTGEHKPLLGRSEYDDTDLEISPETRLDPVDISKAFKETR